MAFPKLSNTNKANTNKKQFSTHQNPVVRAKFPAKTSVYPKPAILKINKILAFSLLAAVFLSMASYLGVIAKENKIKEFHSLTNRINHENIQLQNQVDYLKSFYLIDHKVQKVDFLKKPDKVIEVNGQHKMPVFSDNKEFFDITTAPGY